MKKTAMLGLLVGLLTALGAAGPSQASPVIVDGGWLGFCFDDGGPATAGCQNEGTQTGGNTFTFTALTSVEFKITDAFSTGDTFSVSGDFSLTTPPVPDLDPDIETSDPDVAFADSRYSHASVILAAGSYSFDVSNVHGCCEGGGAYLEVVTQQVPEPGTLALLGVALAGIAFRRRRKHS